MSPEPPSRDDDWAALHAPETDAATLARIAQQHPEFAEAITRHPNCYPELRDWALAQQGVGRAAVQPTLARDAADAGNGVAAGATTGGGAATAPSTDRARPAGSPSKRSGVIVAAAAAGAIVLAGGAVWAATSLGAPASDQDQDQPMAVGDTPSPDPVSTRTLAGPPVYIGDELDWLTLADSEITHHFPAAGSVASRSDYGGIGESEGFGPTPAACVDWYGGDDWARVGVRIKTWDHGAMTVSQFPTGAEADGYFHGFVDNTALCASFTMGTQDAVASTVTVTPLASDATSVVARIAETGDYGGKSILVLVHEGNTDLEIRARDDGQPDAALRALRDAVADRALEARAQLTEKIGYR